MQKDSAIILILIAVGLFYTFTGDQYKQAKELHAIASQYRDVLDNALAISALRDQLQVTYESMPDSDLELMSKMLPDNVDTVRLALELDGIAAKYGVTIESIQVENKSGQYNELGDAGPAYDKATVHLSFISDYEGFSNVLTDIEKSLRIMDVKTVVFQTNETGLNEYRVSVDTYWLK